MIVTVPGKGIVGSAGTGSVGSFGKVGIGILGNEIGRETGGSEGSGGSFIPGPPPVGDVTDFGNSIEGNFGKEGNEGNDGSGTLGSETGSDKLGSAGIFGGDKPEPAGTVAVGAEGSEGSEGKAGIGKLGSEIGSAGKPILTLRSKTVVLPSVPLASITRVGI